jgi:hypothetical protein
MVTIHRLFLAFSATVLCGALALTPVAAAEPKSSPANEASRVESRAYKAGEFAGDVWQSTKEAARKAWDATKETAQKVWYSGKETAREGWSSGKETAQGAWDATKEKTSEVTRDLKEGWKDGSK